MTLNEIANELVAGCRENRARANLQTLYAPDAQSVEAADMGNGTTVTVTPCALRIAAAVASSASAPRAFSTRSTPASASASAQPRPNPLDAPQTSARFPDIPKFIASLRYFAAG